MKIVLFAMSLILVTSAQAAKLTFTWDKKEIEALKGKEVYSFYCAKKTGGFTKEVCDRAGKSASFKKFKFKTLEWVDRKTIRMGDGPRSVEIKRGDRPGSFSMNGKSFDYGTMTPDQVREKIRAALPRVGRVSLFMNAAYAAELGEIVQDLQEAVNLMAAEKSDEERCEIFRKVALFCEEKEMEKPNTESVMAAVKNYTQQKTRADQEIAGKKALAAIENFSGLIEQARDLVSRAHHLQVSCSGDYRETSMQSEDISHDCTGRLENFKLDYFNPKINKIILDDAIGRTTYKNIELRFDQVVKQMETFFNRKLSPYDKQEIIEVMAPVK